MNAIERKVENRTKKRLQGQEPDASRYLPKKANSQDTIGVLNRRPHPDVVRPRQLLGKRQGAFGALCEDVERMLGTGVHGLEHLPDEGGGNVLVEQIAHRIHEDKSRLP